jgi:hypothetical protein
LKKVKAGATSITVFWTAIGFWIPQMVLWMIGLFGLGGDAIPFLEYFIPGQLIYILSYVLILLIGLGTMIYAAAVYYIRGVNCFGGYKTAIFILCLTGYLVIFINFFPWFVIWLLAVSMLQDD